jgi:hypothetical protein
MYVHTRDLKFQDIDLDDPELAFAATKIQAGYRGMKTRKDTRQLKKERAHHDSPEETVDHDDHESARDDDGDQVSIL